MNPTDEPVTSQTDMNPGAATPQAFSPVAVTGKSYLTAFILSLFFGGFGVDRFYLGRIGTGILKFLTIGGLGVWALIDFVLIAFNKLGPKDNSGLQGYEKNKKTALVIFLAMILVQIAALVVLAVSAMHGLSNLGTKAKTTPKSTTASVSTPKVALPPARWTYSATEATAVQKFVAKYNNAALSRNICEGEPVNIFDVHIKGYQTVFRYHCNQSPKAWLALFEQSPNSPDDWELRASNMDESKLPAPVYDQDASFYGTTYGVSRTN